MIISEPSVNEILIFLKKVDLSFPVPLSQKQDLTKLAEKLAERATICAEIRNNTICSMVAGYTNDTVNNTAYISIAATLEEHRGYGFASKLIKEFIREAESSGLTAVHLYAATSNKSAINMYKHIGFKDYFIQNEPRPEDAHLIYYIQNGDNKMNILLTSVGRRAYMIKYFKSVLNGNGQVHVCNSDDLTVAFQYADQSVISPLIYDEEYIPFLLKYCKENKIDILISLFDIDLYILAKNKAAFAAIGTRVVVSDADFVSICNDKWKTYEFLKEHGFNTPKTYLTLQKTMLALDKGELHYPVIVKPRFGCGSIAMSIARDEMALLFYYSKNTREVSQTYLKYESAFVEEKVIFQEMLSGQEYGVDIINDFEGVFQNSIVKKKIAMRSGETDISETVDEPAIYEETKRLGKLTGHIANMDCDVFLVDGKPYILEMNARFGGGYPFSHIAGVNLPKAIVNWHKGEKVDIELLKAKTGVRAYKELTLTVEGEAR